MLYRILEPGFHQWLLVIGNMDLSVQHWLQFRQMAWLSKILVVITQLGSPAAFVCIATLVFILLGWRKRWLAALFSLTCLLSTWVFMHYLKNAFERPRPLGVSLTTATGFSFPSGHAMLSTAYYGFLVLLLINLYPGKKRFLLTIFIVFMLLIGFSRIYLNVHYTSDVLAGYALGSLMLALNWLGWQYYLRRR